MLGRSISTNRRKPGKSIECSAFCAGEYYRDLSQECLHMSGEPMEPEFAVIADVYHIGEVHDSEDEAETEDEQKDNNGGRIDDEADADEVEEPDDEADADEVKTR